MTNRAKIMLRVVASGVVGLVAGGVIAAYGTIFFFRMDANSRTLMNVVHVKEEVGLLKILRKGDNDWAIETLEMHLDGDVLGLGLDTDISTTTRDTVSKSINLVREYRTEFPRKSVHTEIDNAVRSRLSL